MCGKTSLNLWCEHVNSIEIENSNGCQNSFYKFPAEHKVKMTKDEIARKP